MLVYILFDVLPRIEFDKVLKNIKFSKGKTILIPAVDYLKYSRIISRNFKNINSNLKIIRLPFFDFPYGIKNAFYNSYNTNYDYRFLAFPNQDSFSNNLNKATDITIGIPKEVVKKRSIISAKYSIIIDIPSFGNGYYTPEYIDKLIELIKKIESLDYLNFVKLILVFHPSCNKNLLNL